MVLINTIEVSPPLLNSSCAWSSGFDELQALYNSSYTGAITTRTATLSGFNQNDSHTVHFTDRTTSSINSYGYSPHPLSDYLQWVEAILRASDTNKPVIISITASTPDVLQEMISAIQSLRARTSDAQRNGLPSRIAIEINTSCPNIVGSSPSGYALASMSGLLQVLADAFAQDNTLTIGLKLPPYTYKEQYLQALTTLDSHITADGVSPVSFLTSTNTLGSSLLFSEQTTGVTQGTANYALPTALGGVAGDLLHPLALGNVYSFYQLTRGPEAQFPRLSKLKLIGVGGVTSKEAAGRMRGAGADMVACATLFGKEGVKAFEILST